MLSYLILLALQGLVVGALARLALPGKDPMSIPMTIAVGLGGSLIAGLIVYYATDHKKGPGFIVALFFSVLIVYAIRRSRGGSLTHPGEARNR